ncbi:nucleotidyl transferase AbiEii/AbiGii toxin family protein [Aerococcaceae bacterium zg-ZJ1578]|nr:nucleotidyl transferase AbiEii/AbiGii toxin family protein [Aerococcaceae bacterium zg-1578]
MSKKTHPIETVLVEKYESVIKRNIASARMRDFYDLYSLYHLRKIMNLLDHP